MKKKLTPQLYPLTAHVRLLEASADLRNLLAKDDHPANVKKYLLTEAHRKVEEAIAELEKHRIKWNPMEPLEQKLEHYLLDKYDDIERYFEDSACKANGSFAFDPNKSLSEYIETHRSSICQGIHGIAKQDPYEFLKLIAGEHIMFAAMAELTAHMCSDVHDMFGDTALGETEWTNYSLEIMTKKIGTIGDELNITLAYNLVGAFRYDRQDQAKKWMRMKDTPRLINQLCKYREDYHKYCDPDCGFAHLCARATLEKWRMRREEMHYFYGMFKAGGQKAIDEFFGLIPHESE